MKLTLHDACWDAAASLWSDRALAAQLRWIKVIDDPARAFGVAQARPTCQVIYRKVAPADIEQLSDLRRHPEFREAQACAEMFVRLTDVRSAANLWVEGANEVKLADADDAAWYGRVEALRSQLLAARNLRAVIGNFATGNPEPELYRAWLRAYLVHGGRRDALLGQHEYGAIGLPAAQDLHNLLRHRMLVRAAGDLARGFRWAITECGLDRVQIGGAWVGGGWRAAGADANEAAYWAFMLDYNAELERDPEVVCAAVFTYGDTGRWVTYELNDAQTFNLAWLAALAADPGPVFQPSPMPPEPGSPEPGLAPTITDCDRTDVPDDWTHTVEATLGLNVRSEPVVADNKRCALINGRPVRVLRRQGDWMEIDWPASGWCFAANLRSRETPPLPELRRVGRARRQRVVRGGRAVKLKVGDRFIDVSAWQDPADLDWRALAWNGCSAVMIRLAAGTQTDPEWRAYGTGAEAAGLPWFGYVYFSFVAPWEPQFAALQGALRQMTRLPTIVIDLEGANPQHTDADLRAYIDALERLGAPLGLYTRQSWVAEHLPQLHTILGDVPLIVANYRYPVGTEPALPTGWRAAAAWQHVAGEKVVSDTLYWARYKTRSGKYLDESVVLEGGLAVRCGKAAMEGQDS